MDSFGFWSIIPPIIAIIMVLLTRSVIVSLFLGLFSGILLLTSFNPISSLKKLLGDYLFVTVADEYNAGILILLVFIGGFVALLENSGGAKAFANHFISGTKSRIKIQLAAWFSGIIIFFSEMGTPLIVGPIYESLFDKAKISREKLAWIIDSTASPVSVMIPFIGWGVYIMGLIDTEFKRLSIDMTSWDAFITSIPYFIYPVLAVLIVPLIILLKLDFGPMKKAEDRIMNTGEIYWENAKPLRESVDTDKDVENKSKPILIWLPILILIISLFSLLAPKGFPFQSVEGKDFRIALSLSYFFAAISIIIMMLIYKVKTISQSLNIYTSGMKNMTDILIILVLAWSLGSVLDKLGTANYIVQIIDGTIPPAIVPALIFLVGACMSFANGTSWGTFAIMLPLAIPLGYHLDLPLTVCIGAVISGGIFGDHSSPISDTTILSSTGAGADHKDHNKTQVPIALFNGVVTAIALLITSIVGFKFTLIVAIVFMIIGVLIINRIQKYKYRT
ncbi:MULTISPECIES: Na+/H+ antiporter NhaC family protein [Mammaliicoccus]|uniref:Na+/H+ antiporter NhaC family protein n=1 Tax=Mammaliicoccus TaxID=2803850 RepID=UPI000991B37C|nr:MULTISPECIES: Na+/H+ antiporter NhaC family protein [Mammaliicoccus]HCN60657.1 sodium:proton exchanger [Staphylococcus sp.]MBO3062609.1 sodium:proton exchanger [Mammaliicoccus fleurettii]MBW0764673.1 sodium:proton exchanger [Mammaliicoccus fleurettii]MEB7723273.1 sodium:proton exchanger [Mammaliicoccus fleurettii]MEB7780207.1 sodium:proton exchanger [Mammaliicoccus fleurettii]